MEDSDFGDQKVDKTPHQIVSINSTVDHKPETLVEKQRIIANGGRVAKFNGNIGPLRYVL
jgi:hypothetical protein